MSEKRRSFLLGAMVTLMVLGGVKLGIKGIDWYMNEGTVPAINLQTERKLKDLEGLMRRNYLKADEIDTDKLKEGMYAGIVQGLGDPYSKYYSAEEYRDVKRSNQGNYAGVGIVIVHNKETGEVTISQCEEGRPASQAGLQAGDVLLQINDQKISDMEFPEVGNYIRQQEEGSILHFIVKRGEEQIEADVTVDLLESIVVKGEMLDQSVGYIMLTEFTEGTPHQFEEALEELKKQGMERLIIDLRGNPGGLLDSVCDTLRTFMPKGLLVSVNRSDGEIVEHTCDGESPLEIPLVVMIDQNSASSAEIFAGAVRDHEMGTLVGVKTFGKGVVQSYYSLNDGSVLRLTAASYLTPDGTDLNGTGITPDVEAESMTVQDLIAGEPWEDRQLIKGVEIVNSIETGN